MRVNRKFIYTGVFLVAIGAVLVAADLGGVASATLQEALRYWPLALVAVGVALMLRRSPLGLTSGVVAAVAPGLVLGSLLAVAPRYGYDCGANGQMSPEATQTGAFTGPASVEIRSGCGSLAIGTQAGSGWSLTAANSAGYAPTVDATDSTLTVWTVGVDDYHFLRGGRDEWQLALPADRLADLDLNLDATKGTIALPGARLSGLSVRTNLSELSIDASDGAIDELSVNANLASVILRLSALGDLSGSIRADAANVILCVPPELGLQVTSRVSAGQVTVGGLEQSGGVWVSPSYSTATYHADINVNASLANVEINPTGGCS